MSEPVLELRGVGRTYATGQGPLEVLRGVDLAVVPGEVVGLIGPSGSGKSSLLHAAGLLERPTAGQVLIEGRDCSNLSDAARTRIRLGLVGFVYQFHHLLPEFSALDHQPGQLSGGEQQRVAVARALANQPRVVLADEPTGNLDPETSAAVSKSLFDLAHQTGVALIIATHNMDMARHMDRVFALRDKHLVEARQ